MCPRAKSNGQLAGRSSSLYFVHNAQFRCATLSMGVVESDLSQRKLKIDIIDIDLSPLAFFREPMLVVMLSPRASFTSIEASSFLVFQVSRNSKFWYTNFTFFSTNFELLSLFQFAHTMVILVFSCNFSWACEASKLFLRTCRIRIGMLS